MNHGSHTVILHHEGGILVAQTTPVIHLCTRVGIQADGVHLRIILLPDNRHGVHKAHAAGAAQTGTLLRVRLTARGREVTQQFHQVSTLDHVGLEDETLLGLSHLLDALHAPRVVGIEFLPCLIVGRKQRSASRLSQHGSIILTLGIDQLQCLCEIATAFEFLVNALTQP